MVSFVPVDHDPFTEAQPGAQQPQGQPSAGPRFIPVDHDPFAGEATGDQPSGFGRRAQREGDDTQMRQAEHLADAVRTREQQDKAGPIGRLDAYGRGVASWVPGMNKLAAAGDAAFGAGKGQNFGERYSDNLERQRAMDTADEALNPGSRFTGQGAGLMATAAVLPSVNLVKDGLRGAATANAAATGGLYGAVTGAIETDGGAADKALGALESGSIGTLVGSAAPSVIGGVGAVARGVGSAANAAARPFRSAINPEGEAGRRISAAFERDKVADPAARLAEMQAQGAPAVMADVGGETTRALARSAANTSPEAREALTTATSERFAGQGDRITELLRGFGPANAGKTLDELHQAARDANKPAYGKAYFQGGRGVWNEDLESLAQAPAVQDAIRSVIKTGANKTVADGMPPVRNPFTTDAAGNLTLARKADGSVATPNLQFWDYVQRELRGKAGEAGRAGNKDLAGDFNNLRRSIVDQLDTAVPAFKEARSGAAAAFQAEDALEAGQKFVTAKMRNEDAAKALSKMKPPERELFAEGFRSDLISKIRETADGRDIVKAIFGSPAARQRVDIALGPKQAGELEAVLKTESAMLHLQTALGNSTTARQLYELGAAAGLGYYQGGTPGAIAGATAMAALRKGNTKINAGLAKKVGEMLASGDRADVQKVVKMATKSPALMKLIETIGDDASKVVGLNPSVPLEVTLRPGGTPVNLPAAAEQEQQ